MLRTSHCPTVTLTVFSLLLGGCGETQLPQATGKGEINGINAIVGFGEIGFLIEERTIGPINYKSAVGAEYDDLSYTFNFDLPLPGSGVPPERLASLTVDVVRDTIYWLALTGDTSAQQVTLWERPRREWVGDESVFDVMVGHANPALGAVDVYLAPGGTMPVAGNALGSVEFRELIDPREFESGEYQVTLTPAGDPATILYRSAETNIPAAQSYLLTVFETDPEINGPVSLRIIPEGGIATELADERFPATSQFLHASIDQGAVDIAIDADYANPAVSNLGYGEISSDIEVPTPANYQYAPTGTTTAILEADRSVFPGSTNLQILAGDESAPAALQLGGLRRGYSTVGRLRFLNTITQHDSVDVYILEPGTSIDDSRQTFFGIPFGFSEVLNIAPDDYEITVAETQTTADEIKTTLAGPVLVSLEAFDTVEVVLLDDPDPAAAQILTIRN